MGPPSPWQRPRGGCERAGLSQARGSGPCSPPLHRGWGAGVCATAARAQGGRVAAFIACAEGTGVAGGWHQPAVAAGAAPCAAEGTRALGTTRPLPSCQQQGRTPRCQTGEWFWCKGLRFLKACLVFAAVSVALRRDSASP